MHALLPIFAGVFGLVIGSFLNVVIYRVPRGESLLRPASHCPRCDTPIKPWHNVPVVSWLVLRGRCATCGEPISPRYPLVEAGTAVLFVVLALRFPDVRVAAFLFLGAIGVALSAIDIEHRRLPDRIVLPSYPVVAVLLVVASAVTGDWWALGRAGIGAVALFAFFFAIAFISPKSMGLGDVKLAGILGGALAYIGWAPLVIGAFLGFFLGAIFGVSLMVAHRGGRKTAIPFGPFMLLGALVGLFVAQPIADAYLGLF